MASTMVTAAGRPSGIAPTASATAAMNISTGFSPAQSADGERDRREAQDNPEQEPAELAILRVRGVSRLDRLGDQPGDAAGLRLVAGGPDDALRRARRSTSVPAKARFAVGQQVSSASGSECLWTGTDSPVSADSSTCRLRT